MKPHLSLVLFTLLLLACVPQASSTPTLTQTSVPLTSLPSTVGEAQNVLVNFLTLLNTKAYADSVSLYGGDYDQLHVFNPEIDPKDHAALWSWACDNHLLQCLQVRSTTLEKVQGDSYIFQVQFNNPDGSLFVLGPCCGANATEMPPVSQFEFTVSRNAEHNYVVMNLPPYVP